MKQSTSGLYKRDGKIVEVKVRKNDDYSDVARKACEQLGFDPNEATYALFKQRGAILPNRHLSMEGQSIPLTLGNYMRVMHYSVEEVKFGVGEVSDHDSSEEEDMLRQHSCMLTGESSKRARVISLEDPLETADVEVLYAKEVGDKLLMKEAKSHERIWEVETGVDPSRMDERKAFYPEELGYQVCTVAPSHRNMQYLRPALTKVKASAKFIVSGYSGSQKGLKVAYQSPSSVRFSQLKPLRPIYCVASIHTLDTEYEWYTVPAQEDASYPSSPVIYSAHSGLYGCRIKHKGVVRESNLMDVMLVPDSEELESQVSSQSDLSTVVGAKSQKAPSASQPHSSSSAMEFSAEELDAATGNRSESCKLGVGGFGVVYEGMLQHTKVAIKYLSLEGTEAILRPKDGKSSVKQQASPEELLRTELSALQKWCHPNLVPLMGFCGEKPALVYEYMCRGSLYTNLHEAGQPLTWQERVKVLIDTCCGLAYLHSSKPPLVHQDIKSQNILIDGHGNGRIGDFGFSLELPNVVQGRTLYIAQSFAHSEGYYPSELSHGKYSPKSDVYSYGVVVLETYTGEQAYDDSREDRKLVEHCQDDLSSPEQFITIADKRLTSCPDDTFFFKVINASLLRHSKRPTSAKVLEMWESAGATQIHQS